MDMKRVKIDESKCIGCGACTAACHQDVIGTVNGKAKLLREEYCDGLGNCLPVCPVDAITFESNGPAHLNQWPIQIKLVPPNAPYFDKANLLVAADCAAYAYSSFYNDYMKDKTTIIGCPKLDGVDYSEKLTEILKNNDIKSLIVARMEVPCCAGIVRSVKVAVQNADKPISYQAVTISTDGRILS